ncbi:MULTISPECIES: amidohydrolase family protein [unclassified Roseitalea]|uniref:amidohydrolase family protein n=1 Tax=unclassified Roseitalea TaxID=2639107 RepID=UPI00273CFAD9|nr:MULTISPECIES: amidohydrolase family protein [unclassified Roseitalea]
MSETVLESAAIWARPWAQPPQWGGKVRLAAGRIASIAHGAPTGDHLLVPGLVNAHDHGRGVRPLAIGAPDAPLEAWLWDLWRAPRTDPYLTALVAFGRMALCGVTTVVHNHLPQGDDLAAEAHAIARAARDVGLRLSFVVPILDRNLAGYDDGAAIAAALPADAMAELRAAQALPPVAEQIALVPAIAEAIDGPDIVTQFGPPGPHWLSEPAWQKVGAAASAQGRRTHVHLLETAQQRAWVDAHQPAGAHVFFDQAGLLNDRLTIAHGVWLRPDEIAAFAQAGATLALNTSSNLRLASGIADGAALHATELCLGIGLDGMAMDDDADMLREVRLAAQVLGGRGFDRPGLPRKAVLAAAFSTGRRAHDGVAAPGLVEGAEADLVALSVEALAADRLDDDPDTLAALAMGRWSRSAVREVHVAGRKIVAEGRLTGVDLETAEAELVARARAARRATPPPAWIGAARAARLVASAAPSRQVAGNGAIAIHDMSFGFDPELFAGVRDDPVHAARLLGVDVLPARIDVPVWAYLIVTADGPCLVDTGGGHFMNAGFGGVAAALAARSIAPGDIVRVYLTHLHGDHCGGLLAANGAAAFPNARLALPAAEADCWLGGDVPQPMRAIADEAARAIAPYADRTDRIAPGDRIGQAIAIEASGHTPGHTAWLFERQHALACGDIIHVPAIQLAHPQWSTDWDMDADAARATRLALMRRARQSDLALLTGHGGILHPAALPDPPASP